MSEQIEQSSDPHERCRDEWYRAMAERDYYRNVLVEIANEDFRGNRSSASIKAFQALNAPHSVRAGRA